ncbi:MAG: lipopolysaccharide biosynthesis protein [Hyphomicrobiaceae bacterium]|nr:lipopolysaccharide biosynthesis protein [Hyphomicrobiaceae bacterium]
MSRARRLLSQSTLLFVARLAGAALIFLVQAGIARTWGSAILADYLVLIALANIAAMIMPLGFQTIGAYFAAEYRAKGERRTLTAFILRAYWHLGASVLVIATLGVVYGLNFEVGAEVLPLLPPFLVLALATGSVFMHGAVLVGLKHPVAGFLADGLARPLIILFAFVTVFFWANPDVALGGLAWTISAVYAVIAIGYGVFAWRKLDEVDDNPLREMAEDEVGRWWRFALPWVMISIATDFFFDLDLLFLSPLLDKHSLAVFGVAARVFALTSFGVTAVYAVLLPDMFEADANKDRPEFLRQLGDANLVASASAVALIIAMAAGGPLVLWLFGPDFAEGMVPLLVLGLILVVRAAFGPSSIVLSLNDRPWASLPAIGAGLGTLVLFNALLVPPMHELGAAFAALGSILVWSALLWREAYRQTGIDVSVWPRLRQILSQRDQANPQSGA